MNLRHRLVKFRMRDVYLPDPTELLFALHGDEELRGEVVDFSDSESNGVFAVVEVVGIARPVLVPVARMVVVTTERAATGNGQSAKTQRDDEPESPPPTIS
jgi:hypothetical protein